MMKKWSLTTAEVGVDGVGFSGLLEQAMSKAGVAKNEVSEEGKVALEHERDAVIKELEAVLKKLDSLAEGQEGWRIAADDFLALYWAGDNRRTIDFKKMRAWLMKNQPLDRWFYIHLIEAAGKKALELGYSERASQAAKSKNIEPRAWVLIEWVNRTKKASKSAFAKRYAALVESKFGVKVTPNTIERKWLPIGKPKA